MFQHAMLNDSHIKNQIASETVNTSAASQVPVLHPESTLATDESVERVEQFQHIDVIHEQKVSPTYPGSPLHNDVNNGSEYEGCDEKSPMWRNDMARLVVKRPQSAKLVPTTSRPDSAKVKSSQSSLKKTSTFLLDALLSSKGCPGPSLQTEALAASWQGQLSCLFRLSVFIWPVWLDEVAGKSTHKIKTNSGIVLEMSHREILLQLNSLCQAQDNGTQKGVGQNDAAVHHMVNVCVKRCSELLRAHDFNSTKQILQKIFQLSRRLATTARNQLKLLPLKIIAAMLHIGDGNVRDAAFELRSAIESIPIDQENVKPFITTDVAILYNHLSYYYSLLGSRVEACKYTKMGIEVMAENRSTMARSDMSSQHMSVHEVSDRHMYIDAVLMINQVVAEVSNEHADIQAAKTICSDAVMFLEEVTASAACAALLTEQLLPLVQNIQKVFHSKMPADGPSELSFSEFSSPPGVVTEKVKVVPGNPKISSKGSARHSTMSAGTQYKSEHASSVKNSSANTKQFKLDLSTSFGMVRSQSQIYSLKTPKTKMKTLVTTSRPPSAIGSRTVSASPNAKSMRGNNSKFKMLMLGPALAKCSENRTALPLSESADDQIGSSKLPECLIRAMFPPSYHSSKFPIENDARPDAHSPNIFDVELSDDMSFATTSKNSSTHDSKLKKSYASEHIDFDTRKNGSARHDHQSTKNKASLPSSVNEIKIFDINSLRLCCNLIKSLTYPFDSLEEASHQQIKLAAHCASKLGCELCYLFKLEGKSPRTVCATTLLSSGKHVSVDLAQGGIIATQMNRFLQNGVLMRPVVIFDDEIFTEANDSIDSEILPINAEECSIMMGVIPGYSQFNKISGFMIAIRSPPAASFDPEGLLVCELLCNCCSQSLPLL